MNEAREKLADDMEDYKDTIFAIIAFCNLFRYDDATGQMKTDVVVFQGRRLKPSGNKRKPNGQLPDHVSPDLGVAMLSDTSGVLGEVKKSFPRDETRWIQDFEQLMSYDDELDGWPTPSGSVGTHDIVLLLHHSRGTQVKGFYETRAGDSIRFHRPFAMVEFSRSDERKKHVFLRTLLGDLSSSEINSRLARGVPVPLTKLLTAYSTVKLYDAEPPLPYLMKLAWENVVMPRASDSPKFTALRKNQVLNIDISVDEIVQELHECYSFHGINGDTVNQDHQPHIPRKEWVLRACKKMVECGDAEWIDSKEGRMTFRFRKYDDVQEHFMTVCLDEPGQEQQMKMFEDELPNT